MGNTCTNTVTEEYFECKRCNISSETQGRLCPCPRGSCEAMLTGEVVTTIVKTIIKTEGCAKLICEVFTFNGHIYFVSNRDMEKDDYNASIISNEMVGWCSIKLDDVKDGRSILKIEATTYSEMHKKIPSIDSSFIRDFENKDKKITKVILFLENWGYCPDKDGNYSEEPTDEPVEPMMIVKTRNDSTVVVNY